MLKSSSRHVKRICRELLMDIYSIKMSLKLEGNNLITEGEIDPSLIISSDEIDYVKLNLLREGRI